MYLTASNHCLLPHGVCMWCVLLRSSIHWHISVSASRRSGASHGKKGMICAFSLDTRKTLRRRRRAGLSSESGCSLSAWQLSEQNSRSASLSLVSCHARFCCMHVYMAAAICLLPSRYQLLMTAIQEAGRIYRLADDEASENGTAECGCSSSYTTGSKLISPLRVGLVW